MAAINRLLRHRMVLGVKRVVLLLAVSVAVLAPRLVHPTRRRNRRLRVSC
jgi:hypothetical protein